MIRWRGHLDTDAVAILGSIQMEIFWESEGQGQGVEASRFCHELNVMTPLLSVLQENAGLRWDCPQAPFILWQSMIFKSQ